MKKIVHALVVFIILLSVGEIYSLPRFALTYGGFCSDCHVNPTGGVLRNNSGWHYGKAVIPMSSPRDEFKMTNRVGENIMFGLDFRGQTLLQFMEGGRKIDFQRMSAAVYTGVELSDKITIFGKYDMIQSYYEGYLVAKVLPNNGYIKGGTFSPNFGIRLDDHTAYTEGGDLGFLFQTGVRQGLIYEPGYVESGAELGLYFSDFAFFTASVGQPNKQLFQTDPVYTANLQLSPYLSDAFNLFFGGSFSTFKQLSFNPDIPGGPTKMYGGYLGLGIGRFMLLGEYDIARDYRVTDGNTTAMMIKAIYNIIKGLDAIARYDRFDPDVNTDSDDVSRIILGLEFFPYSFIEIRPQYRIQMEEPKVSNDTFLIQFHLYY